ncbi:ATP-dependent 6-phosphofructokinase 5, chloroplastic [Spinacia oleracea]|uniref:ATP-dependent 6-phosphofructokinase n=1 Tax=Spinacia oleracea TaxID=3562 RepID=A0A9R0HR70_SPIOL|nr:ATP-dependent 6-phosphofructokinase 5, chloroplastic [Spinacia oleracea]
MASVSSMNNACLSNLSAHVPMSNRDQHRQLYYGNLRFKWMGRHSSRKIRFSACRIVAEKLDIDFSDPDWKTEYQKDFENTFNLPHLKDVLDVKPRPSTFSLMHRDGSRWLRNENVTDRAEGPEDRKNDYVDIDDRTLLKVIKYASPTSAGAECIDPNCTWVEQWVHRAGPRKEIYFEPTKVKAAIVTCGGLCPGLNDVIRQIFFTLERYGVQKIFGVRYGFRGFFDPELPMKKLSREHVQDINLEGGSLLGTSRGGASTSDIVDSIEAKEIDMVFILGGNGTHAGANAIHNECRKRKMKVSVICVPKTIDNDILLMDKTFGFDTAVEAAQRAINSAYIEAHSAYHGIGLVKLMGRSSGFIAMHASLASGQVDICLIPEVPFTLDGPNGVLSHLEHLIRTKGAAVVCVAEGAGQELLAAPDLKDLSGNAVLGDIGVHFKNQIKSYFNEKGIHADVKYIDPTYMVRSVRANASDAILCTVLGQNAVHGAFAGYSGITMGICNTHYVFLPITEVIHTPRAVNPNSRMWHRCLTSTGQPDFSPRNC